MPRVRSILLALTITVAVTATFRWPLAGANAATVGFSYLIAVLIAASAWGFLPALAAALAATAQYNLYFLPPVGSWSVEDPQNWVALAAFLAAALIASRLSTGMRQRALEAEARRRDTARLFELSRAILLADPRHECGDLERALVRIFELRDARIEVGGETLATTVPGPFSMHWRLTVGQQPIGALHLDGPPLAAESAEAIAGMIAISLERARLRGEAARLQTLRDQDALRSALLDAFTHELRTPLTAIKAAATALLSGAGATSSGTAELAAVIAEESDRLDSLLDNLLVMARIESGALRPTLTPQPVESLLSEALASYGSGRGNDPVRLELPPELPPILADGPLTSRALAQVLANAEAYSPPGSPITIAAEPLAGSVRIVVADRGPGVPAAALPHIFDKFYRAPEARGRRPEGLGMGLAIARGLIQAQGGSVGADCPPGGGLRIWFTLPEAGRVRVSRSEAECGAVTP